jgi:hypothetical protein
MAAAQDVPLYACAPEQHLGCVNQFVYDREL